MSASIRHLGVVVRELISGERLAYGLTSTAWILWHASPLLFGLLAKLFFDELTGSASFHLGILAILALFLAVGLGRAATLILAAAAGTPMSFRMVTRVRTAMVERLYARPGGQVLDRPVGEALSTFRRDAERVAQTAHWPFDAVAGAVLAGGGLAVLLSVNWQITLVTFIPVVAVILLAQHLRLALSAARERSRHAAAAFEGALGEVLEAADVVRAFGAEEDAASHLAAIGRERRDAEVRDAALNAWSDAMFSETASLGAGVVLLIAAGAMRQGSFTIGDFALFATYLTMVTDFTGFLGHLLSSLREAVVSLRRVAQLTLIPPAALLAAVGAGAAGGSLMPFQTLEVKGLKPLGDKGPVVTFTLQKGTLTVLRGPVGSGKSTLLRMVLGLVGDGEGEVRWNGQRLVERHRHLVPPRCAYVPQRPAVLSDTWRANLELGRAERGESLARALDLAALTQEVSESTEGLNTVLGRDGARLSGGQEQRTALARAVAAGPELLVLDDATSAVDVETESRIVGALRQGGYTLLVATGSDRLLDEADQVVDLTLPT